MPAEYATAAVLCVLRSEANAQATERFTRREVEGAVHVDAGGIEGSDRSWHLQPASVKKLKGDVGQRAVLMQSLGHLATLHETHPAVKQQLGPQGTLFGENVTVGAGFNTAALCVGDVIKVRAAGAASPLVLRVASPRKPCAAIDELHNDGVFVDGVRARCAGTGLAGWHCRVVTPGAIAKGDELYVAERPHAAWPLQRVAGLLGTCSMDGDLALWRGTAAELRELIALDDLAVYEWRDKAEAVAAAQHRRLVHGAAAVAGVAAAIAMGLRRWNSA
jgi:MOSC domain-containing protein YiiM